MPILYEKGMKKISMKKMIKCVKSVKLLNVQLNVMEIL